MEAVAVGLRSLVRHSGCIRSSRRYTWTLKIQLEILLARDAASAGVPGRLSRACGRKDYKGICHSSELKIAACTFNILGTEETVY